jgi:trypsin-like peptidase
MSGTMTDTDLRNAVMRVGDGRGFVVERSNHLGVGERIIITAAHCLPRLPPPYEHLLALPTPHPARYLDEETFQRLLGPLGDEPTVWATCLFVDPIADIAVLGQPDNQALSDEAEAYDALVENMQPLVVGHPPAMGVEVTGKYEFAVPAPGRGLARVLALDGRWVEGQIERWHTVLTFKPEETFVGGMSGSPILDGTGAAIGVVSVESMSPVIVDSLSAHLMRSLLKIG